MSDIDEFLEDVGVGEFEEAPVKNYYATVADFVDGFLSVNYARPVSPNTPHSAGAPTGGNTPKQSPG